MPNTMEPAPLPSVYQLRVVVRGVSPLIWRRLLIPADTTIAGLHAVLQIACGWGGEHLHRFVIHGVETSPDVAAQLQRLKWFLYAAVTQKATLPWLQRGFRPISGH